MMYLNKSFMYGVLLACMAQSFASQEPVGDSSARQLNQPSSREGGVAQQSVVPRVRQGYTAQQLGQPYFDLIGKQAFDSKEQAQAGGWLFADSGQGFNPLAQLKGLVLVPKNRVMIYGMILDEDSSLDGRLEGVTGYHGIKFGYRVQVEDSAVISYDTTQIGSRNKVGQ